MKKLPYPIYLSFFLGILGIICSGLLAGVNCITAPVIKENQAKAFNEILKQANLEYDTEMNGLDTDVAGCYALNGNKVKCAVFQVTTKNNDDNVEFNIIIAINVTNGQIEYISVAGQSGFTTHGHDADFIGNDFGVKNATSSNYEDKFTGISGATHSALAVKNAITVAFSQFEKVK